MCHSSKHMSVNVCLILYLCLVISLFFFMSAPPWRGDVVSQPVEPNPCYPPPHHLKRNLGWTCPACEEDTLHQPRAVLRVPAETPPLHSHLPCPALRTKQRLG